MNTPVRKDNPPRIKFERREIIILRPTDISAKKLFSGEGFKDTFYMGNVGSHCILHDHVLRALCHIVLRDFLKTNMTLVASSYDKGFFFSYSIISDKTK
tara:strand:- start:240 stop:536 length:297 start_codon:yes stop_codon:yes gene_type:complete